MRVLIDDIRMGPILAKEFIMEQIRRHSELKINHMSFYIEHVVNPESQPCFAPDGAITVVSSGKVWIRYFANKTSRHDIQN